MEFTVAGSLLANDPSGSSVRSGRKRASLCSIAALCAGVLFQAPAMAQPHAGGTLRYAVEAEPVSYDCQANFASSFLQVMAPHYSTLLKFDPAAYPQITGDVVESWMVGPDNLTYTFRLRPDVLFHDGTSLTSADVLATYQRILRPPSGVASARRQDYEPIAAVEAPDPLTAVFRLRRPDASMLAKFASPWGCIYPAAKLAADPQYPATHVMGSGPFVFSEHKKGAAWSGRRWNRYFVPGHPYLDGFDALFMNGADAIKALQANEILADFRGIAPAEAASLQSTLGDRISVQQSPWLVNQMLVFNVRKPPFNDVRVRRALSLAIDRWGMARTLSKDTVLTYVGGILRPGSAMGAPLGTLRELPGFSPDVEASRAEARRLLAEAGTGNLNLTLISRDMAEAFSPRADAIIEAWRAIGVDAHEVRLNLKDWRDALEGGYYTVALDFNGGTFDDPAQQFGKYVSRALSPLSYSGAQDATLDQLYRSQASALNAMQRERIVREFERRALNQAYAVPVLWWNRMTAMSASVKGWTITPSLMIGQDLRGVWIDGEAQRINTTMRGGDDPFEALMR